MKRQLQRRSKPEITAVNNLRPEEAENSVESPEAESQFSPRILRQVLQNPHSANSKAILALQKTHGNQAVMRMLAIRQAEQKQAPKKRTISSQIQRDIGFEFEIPSSKTRLPDPGLSDGEKKGTVSLPDAFAPGVQTRQGHTKIKPRTIEPMKKFDVILKGEGFEMQADESSNGGTNLEFVMPGAVPETKEGRTQLDNIMKAMQNVARDLISGTGQVEATDLFDHGTVQRPRAVINTWVAKGGGLEANPQSTVAVRLDQLANFMSKIGSPGKKKISPARMDLALQKPGTSFDFELMSNAPAQAEQAIKAFKKTQKLKSSWGSNQLKGLLALIVSYLTRGDKFDMDYPKLIAPLMARTNFATMFNSLPEAEYFKKTPALWVGLALSAALMDGTGDVKVFKRGMRDEDFGPTRKVWLEQMTNGVDLLTTAASNEDFYMSMGKLGNKTEQVGKGKKLADAPIFEMRRMKSAVPHTEWRGLALDVFDFIYNMNNLKNKKYSRKNRDKINKKG